MENLQTVKNQANQLINRLGLKEAKKIAIELSKCNFKFEEQYFWVCVIKELNKK
jgi:hypothetical protein